MRCPRCQHQNEADAKFCEECAAALPRGCASCGRLVSATAKFCPECAHPTGLVAAPSVVQRFDSPESYTPRHLAERILTSKSALDGERKQVTVLFADMKGSMELIADRDPEEARQILDPALEHMMEAVHRYEGTVNLVMGDGIMALFGAPLAHEDHAVRACYAAIDMQAAIRRYDDELWRSHGLRAQIRAGLNSGEVVVRAIGSDLKVDYSAVGQTTHLAARMEQLATPGTTLVTAETLRLAEGYVTVTRLGPVPVSTPRILIVLGVEEPTPGTPDHVVVIGERLLEPDVAEIERYHQHLLDRAPIRSARIGATLARQTNAVGLDVVRRQLGRGKASGDTHAVVVAAEHQVVAEEEILDEAVRLDRAGKVGAQYAPRLRALTPGLGLFDPHAIHRKKKRRREIGPEGLAVEVSTMQRVPRRGHLVAGKRISRRAALGDQRAVELFDGDPVRCEHRTLIRRAIGHDR